MKYIVTGNIKRDGKPLKIGGVVEFDAEEGDRLVADGYLSGPSASDRAAAEAAMAETGGEETKPAAAAKKTAK